MITEFPDPKINGNLSLNTTNGKFHGIIKETIPTGSYIIYPLCCLLNLDIELLFFSDLKTNNQIFAECRISFSESDIFFPVSKLSAFAIFL